MGKDRITLAMGAGGSESARLIEEVFLPAFGNEVLNCLDDAAEFPVEAGRLAFTTDSYTVKPLFFPGGDIGTLCVCGTVNDLAVKGARPTAIAAGFVIEEGFPMGDLRRIAASMRDAAREAGVRLVAGDTKVVGRGEADGIFITTSGIGSVMPGMRISCAGARAGDAVLVSGTIADHGVAILNARAGLGFTPEIKSDVASVLDIVERLSALGPRIHAMRDPTRGGLASAVNEIAVASGVSMCLREAAIPVLPQVRACCELLGMDPLYLACEGKAVIFVEREVAGEALRLMREAPRGGDAALIGEVGPAVRQATPPVTIETALGTMRFAPLLEGEPLPRIC